MLNPKHSEAHRNGDIHIHDLDFYTLTTTCCQIDLLKLFEGGFSTGHGVLREPNSIASYASLACIAIQSNQNDQHGGQSIPNFDYSMAPGVAKTYKKRYRSNLASLIEVMDSEEHAKAIKEAFAKLEDIGLVPTLDKNEMCIRDRCIIRLIAEVITGEFCRKHDGMAFTANFCSCCISGNDTPLLIFYKIIKIR